MKIPLNEFEQIINENILKRGLKYFKDGAVIDFSEISRGEYEAIVLGSEEYTVQIEINNNVVVDHNCDCPYDMGPVCKHVVAVVFHLQQNELEVSQLSLKAPKKSTVKSISQQIKELTKVISHDELIGFIEEHCKRDKKFRFYFLSSFGHLSQYQSKEFYQKQIHSILQTASGRDGWIGWSEMKYVVKAIQPFLGNAEEYLAKHNFENVFFISTALLEEISEAFQFCDDSNGDLHYFVESAIELLSKIAEEKISENLRLEIFSYCISVFKDQLFSGWDWHLGMLDIAGQLIVNESDADIILACLDTVADGEYERERAQSFTLDLLQRYKASSQVEGFINKHISNSRIRSQEIQKAFESGNFERAIELSKDGIVCDESQKPGLAKDWYDWLLKIALAQNDTSKIIEYARYRLIDNFGGTQDYYQILKTNIKTEEWHPFLEEIIKEISLQNNWTNKEIIRKIYIKEAWWDRLLLMLKQSQSIQNIEQNEQYLLQDYSDELIQLYGERIILYVEQFIGRNHYQEACRYLRRMKKIGGGKQVNELINLFRQQYPQRKALLDELTRV